MKGVLERFITRYYSSRSLPRRLTMLGVVTWTVIVSFDLLSREIFFHRLGLRWLEQMFVESEIETAFLLYLSYRIMVTKEKALKKRFAEIAYINHHIRNAVFVIQQLEYVPQDMKEEVITESTDRILKCVEKISRQDDVTINSKDPMEP